MSSEVSRAPLASLVGSRLWPRGLRLSSPVWIQAVSVGEIGIAASLVAALRAERPGLPLLITSTTPAGVAHLGRQFAGTANLSTRPFPLEVPVSVRRFFDQTAPAVLVLVETELWPLVLRAAARRSVPVLLVNARLSERSARRYRLARRLMEGALDALTRVAARSPEDADRFASIGVPEDRILVGGDMKLDGPLAAPPRFATAFARLAGDRPVLVAGSIATEEIGTIVTAFHEVRARGLDPFLLLAPRRVEAFDEIARSLRAGGLSVVRRSGLEDGADAPLRPDVFLLDSIGELASAYRLGHVAILGGTFAPRGGHNVVEPLRAGLPTVHGPSTASIRRTLDAARGAVFEVGDAAALGAELARLLSSPEARETARASAERLLSSSRGATDRAAALVLSLLDGRPR